jgi:hypothetical protein
MHVTLCLSALFKAGKNKQSPIIACEIPDALRTWCMGFVCVVFYMEALNWPI